MAAPPQVPAGAPDVELTPEQLKEVKLNFFNKHFNHNMINFLRICEMTIREEKSFDLQCKNPVPVLEELIMYRKYYTQMKPMDYLVALRSFYDLHRDAINGTLENQGAWLRNDAVMLRLGEGTKVAETANAQKARVRVGEIYNMILKLRTRDNSKLVLARQNPNAVILRQDYMYLDMWVRFQLFLLRLVYMPLDGEVDQDIVAKIIVMLETKAPGVVQDAEKICGTESWHPKPAEDNIFGLATSLMSDIGIEIPPQLGNARPNQQQIGSVLRTLVQAPGAKELITGLQSMVRDGATDKANIKKLMIDSTKVISNPETMQTMKKSLAENGMIDPSEIGDVPVMTEADSQTISDTVDRLMDGSDETVQKATAMFAGALASAGGAAAPQKADWFDADTFTSDM